MSSKHPIPSSGTTLFSLPLVAGLQAALSGLRLMKAAQRLQMQSVERMSRRGQEIRHRHGQCMVQPLDCLDLPMASMRWAMQEGDQMWQDLILAALELRGELLNDSQSLHVLPDAWLDAGAGPVLNAWGDVADVQMRAWQELMAAARHRQPLWRLPQSVE